MGELKIVLVTHKELGSLCLKEGIQYPLVKRIYDESNEFVSSKAKKEKIKEIISDTVAEIENWNGIKGMQEFSEISSPFKGFSMMKITLFNFGPYHDESVVSFSSEEGNVFLIMAPNGRGKSTIIDAIYWCLYGKFYKPDKAYNLANLINRGAKKQKNYRGIVTLEFVNQGVHYEICRLFEPKPRLKSEIPVDTSDLKVELIMKKDGKDINMEDIENEINNVIPEDIAKFYFLDGETIAEYTSQTANKEEDIEKVIGIPAIISARTLTEEIKEEYRRDWKKASKEDEDLRRIEGQIRNFEKQKEDIFKRKDIIKNQIKNLEFEREDLKKNLERLEKWDSLEKEIQETQSNLEKEKDKKENKLYEIVNSKKSIPLILLFDELHNSIKFVDDKREVQQGSIMEKGKLNGKIELIDNLVNDKIKIELNPTQKAKLLRHSKYYYKKLNRISVDDSFIYEQSLLDFVKERVKQVEEEQDNFFFLELLDELKQIEHHIEFYTNKIEDRKKEQLKIAESDEEYKKDQADFNEVEKQIKRLTEESILLDGQKQNLDKNISELEKESIKQKKERETQISESQKLLELTSKIHKTFESLVEAIKSEVKNKIEQKASEIFIALTNKKDEFRGLKIDNHYNLRIFTHKNELLDINQVMQASEGEKRIIALSFLGWIHSLVGGGTILLDSPFTNIDKEHKKNILSYAPHLSNYSILLVTDLDLENVDLNQFERLGSKWKIERDQSIEGSKIELWVGH